jgi:DNA mismatch endonuclease (patch repair protein)
VTRIAIFCDGDFWHGRDLAKRLTKLERGHNATYWVSKVSRNVERDRRQAQALEAAGWVVLRFWETDILRRPGAAADKVVAALQRRMSTQRYSTKRRSPAFVFRNGQQ